MSISRDQALRRASAAPGALTDVTVAAYAVWTVAANLVVMAGGTTTALVIAGAVSVALVVALFAWLVRHETWLSAYLADLTVEPTAPERVLSLRSTALLLVPPLLTLLVWLATGNPWLAAAGVFVSSVWLALRAAPPPSSTADGEQVRATSSSYERLGLYVLAFLGAAFTLLAVRPRSDDTFYLSMAMSVVDYPAQALLSVNTLHGPVSDTLGPQPMFAPYRVHSFELLGGLISYLTGAETARVIHLGLAPAFAWLLPFAVARLFRIVAPRHVLAAACVVVSFYCLEGSASRGYANHAFVRLWHGKSVLLTVGVPLLCAYGLRFGARPSGIRFALLGLGQIFAVGLSSTGIWLAPTLATLAVVAGAPALRAWPKRVLGSVASSAYVLALGLWILARLGGGGGEPPDIDTAGDAVASIGRSAATVVPPVFARLAEELPIVLGPERTSIALLGVAFAGAALAPNAFGLRLFAIVLLALSAVFANPLLSDLVARLVTGVTTYHRVFWLLPVPVAVALLVSSVGVIARRRASASVAGLSAVAALVAFYSVAIDRFVISADNQAKLVFPPALKLPPHARTVAQEVCKVAPRGEYVLASTAVMQQLPIVHGCGYPLIAAERWLSAPPDDKAARNALAQYIQGPGDLPSSKIPWFIAQLERYGIDTVVLTKDSIKSARTKSLVRLLDFERVAMVDWEHIYERTSDKTRGEHQAVARSVCKAAQPGARVLAPFGVSKALVGHGCAQVVASRAEIERASASEADTLLRLERMMFMPADFEPGDADWLRRELAARAIDTVVLSQLGSRHRELRALLDQLGYGHRKVVAAHTVLRQDRNP